MKATSWGALQVQRLALVALVLGAVGCSTGSVNGSASSASLAPASTSVTTTLLPGTLPIQAQGDAEFDSTESILEDEFDPRRGHIPDMYDPEDRDRALAAMAVYGYELDTVPVTLIPSTPQPWAPAEAPGYRSDVLALEAGIDDSAIQGFRTVFEASLDSQMASAMGAELDGFDNVVTLYPDAAQALASLDRLEEDLTEQAAAQGFDIAHSTREGESFRLEAEDGGFTVAAGGFTHGSILSAVTVAGTDRAVVASVLEDAIGLSVVKVAGILEGALGYGLLPDLDGHVTTATWRYEERHGGLVISFEGAYRESVGTRCRMSIPGMAAEITISHDGRVSIGPNTPALSAGALGEVQTCGRTAPPHLPAYFSTIENRGPMNFLRDLPDLGSVPAFATTVAGKDAVRYDLTHLYQRWFGDLTGAEVERFHVWLNRPEGWPMALEVAMQGDTETLADFGILSLEPSDTLEVTVSMEMLTLDDPHLELEAVALDLMTPPSGSRVAVAATPAEGGATDIYLLEVTGHVRQMTSHPAGDEFPAFSPDGRIVAFTSRRSGNESIYLVDVESGESARLTVPMTDGGDTSPAWSPDGSSIVFASDRPDESAGADAAGFVVGVHDLWVINVDGSGLHRLYGSAGDDLAPAWSPDGKSVAFVSDPTSSGMFGVYTVGIDGEGAALITPEGEGASYWRPAWSPDGRQIVVTRSTPNGSTLVVMSADGSDPTQVLTPANPEAAAFTIDGTHLVYSDGTALWSVGTDGSTPFAITTLGRIHSSGPSVGPLS